jgi:hypothetical protein
MHTTGVLIESVKVTIKPTKSNLNGAGLSVAPMMDWTDRHFVTFVFMHRALLYGIW